MEWRMSNPLSLCVRTSIAAMMLVWASALARAQTGAIHGTVVDQNGRAVESAQISLAPSDRRALSFEDGTFDIPGLKPGDYVLSARRIGYQPASRTISLRDSTATVTITLVAIPAQLDAIHVREKLSGIRYSAVVLDQNDLPVADAEVIAIGINSNLRTDSLGRFTVPGLGRGTLAVRIRKIGYAAYFDSFRILAERADTLRMPRLAQSLTPVEVNEQSGFGRDFWAYREMQMRMAWKGAMAGAISREELDARGKQNLCDALPGTPSGVRLGLHNDPYCREIPKGLRFILVDGAMCRQGLLSDYDADQVEFVEVMPKDWSGSLEARRCGPPAFVIWMRRDAPRATPTRVLADATNPPADTAGPQVRLPPVEIQAAVPLLNPSHLQGQVVDSTNHPIRSAFVYTEDPLFATLTDKNGYFRFGELPSGPITVRAEHSGFMSIEFQLRLPPDSTVGVGLKLLRGETPSGKMQLDSTSGAGAQGRLVRVVSEHGQPIMYANVTLEGATTRITDEKGEINLGIGKRQEFTVRVARIGFAPWFGKVDLPASATMTVTLPRIAQTLAPVTVNGEASPKTALALTGFYDRWMMRQRGALSAVFIGPEEIEFRHPTKVTRMLQGLNGVRLICDITGNCAIHSTSQTSLQVGGGCPMAILLDGNQLYGAVNVDQLINVADVMAIEVYPHGGNMPINLQANDTNCGVVAFWTGSRR
jgi:hypothetical protein